MQTTKGKRVPQYSILPEKKGYFGRFLLVMCCFESVFACQKCARSECLEFKNLSRLLALADILLLVPISARQHARLLALQAMM